MSDIYYAKCFVKYLLERVAWNQVLNMINVSIFRHVGDVCLTASSVLKNPKAKTNFIAVLYAFINVLSSVLIEKESMAYIIGEFKKPLKNIAKFPTSIVILSENVEVKGSVSQSHDSFPALKERESLPSKQNLSFNSLFTLTNIQSFPS